MLAYASSAPIASREGEATASTAEILRLLSAGATGTILLALSEGAMQTKVLTHRIRGYTARTVYRYLPPLARLGAVERDDHPGGPARVVHTLSENGGGELSELVDRFALASMTRLPGTQVEPAAWASLGLLADLWEAGVVEELSRGPRSPSELTGSRKAFSHHQLSRRASRFKALGFLVETRGPRRCRRQYMLTDKARRTMGLVAGLGRWRQRHVDGAGLTVAEATTVLRVALPLARVPNHAGRSMRLSLTDAREGSEATLWMEVTEDGSLRVGEDQGAQADAWARGTVEDWLNALLDGELALETGGNVSLVERSLADLYDRLWTPSPF
jgi:DNA-binding HxlR family transcriptional regulator